MPSTEGQQVGKSWTEERPNGITVDYTIPQGNGLNTVDAIVRDSQGNILSRARIVRVEEIDGTAKYVRWQSHAGGGASYYESGAPGQLGYGQHFAPGTSTSGLPTSVFDASPDLTKVRTISLDKDGNPVGYDVGSRNGLGLYDNLHSDMYNNLTFTETSFDPAGGLESRFTGQIDAGGSGWIIDQEDNRWDVYPDTDGNSVQRRINPITNGYEFLYSEGGIQVHELRDKSGRLINLTKTGPDGKPIKQLLRVGDSLAVGTPDVSGKLRFAFTDSTGVGNSLLVMPWEDRARPRSAELTFLPNGGLRFVYTDGGLAEFGPDGKSTSYKPPKDTRALWKKAVSFAGNYYYGMGTSALGAIEGIGALTGINDEVNRAANLVGAKTELFSREDALKGIAGGVGEVFGTAFAAYKTLGVEGYGLGSGEQSLDEAWRNIRRAVGANWNATSKLAIGTDWEGASGHLAETLGHASFGAAMFFVPVKGVGAVGKGGKPHSGGSVGGAFNPSLVSVATRYLDGRATAPKVLKDGSASRAVQYGRERVGQLNHWMNQPVKSLEFTATVFAQIFDNLQPKGILADGRYNTGINPTAVPNRFASNSGPAGGSSSRGSRNSEEAIAVNSRVRRAAAESVLGHHLDKITDLDGWLKMHSKKADAEFAQTIFELSEVVRVLDRDPSMKVRTALELGPDGKIPEKAVAEFDLLFTPASGSQPIRVEVTTVKKALRKPDDLTVGIQHGLVKIHTRQKLGIPLTGPLEVVIYGEVGRATLNLKGMNLELYPDGTVVRSRPTGEAISAGNIFDDLLKNLNRDSPRGVSDLDRITVVDRSTGAVLAELVNVNSQWSRAADGR
ncbi:hypothetical protein [Nocardia sp. A7]|uniref:hypothetical protein n=1 Tax=Nocardia sp. A7 TaxID=2789274 RepID=UPI0039797FBB